jgi:hypothetical protein
MSKTFNRYNILVGLLLLILDAFIFYYRGGIIIEMLHGRPLNELPIYSLVLPFMLLIVSLFIIFNKKDNEKKKPS